MYAVAKGKVPGIYTTWKDCSYNVTGFSGAIYKKFATRKAAEEFIESYNSINYKSEVFINSVNIKSKEIFKPLIGRNVIYVDGGHNKMTGEVAFASVVNGNGKDLVNCYIDLFDDIELRDVELPVGERTVAISNFNNVTSQQNNGAELLALIMGLRIALYNTKYTTIYSDSSIVSEYWANGRYSDNLGADKIARIRELIKLKHEFNGEIIKISGDDNLADLGFHKKK